MDSCMCLIVFAVECPLLAIGGRIRMKCGSRPMREER